MNEKKQKPCPEWFQEDTTGKGEYWFRTRDEEPRVFGAVLPVNITSSVVEGEFYGESPTNYFYGMISPYGDCQTHGTVRTIDEGKAKVEEAFRWWMVAHEGTW